MTSVRRAIGWTTGSVGVLVAIAVLSSCNGQKCHDPTPTATRAQAASVGVAPSVPVVPPRIPAPDPTLQRRVPGFRPELIESSNYIRAVQAREQFHVNGAGLTVAVLDTGLRVDHVDFGRGSSVPAQRNFTAGNGGDPNNAGDDTQHGHGTNVGGIVVANGGSLGHTGIAPGAHIVPLKVLTDNGGDFEAVEAALQWVLDHHEEYKISVVNMSLGAPVNAVSDEGLPDWAERMRVLIKALADEHIPVVIAAGNFFCEANSKEGMAFPAIFRECISVGAVYDANEGPFRYGYCAEARVSGPGIVTPFTQRLHPSTNAATRTDIFGPGAPVTSSGNQSDTGESVQHGTSQAAPVTCGVILLLQQYHLMNMSPPTATVAAPSGTFAESKDLPTIDQLLSWMRDGGVKVFDGDDERDTVVNTCKEYIRIDALGALEVASREVRREQFRAAFPASDPRQPMTLPTK